MGRQCVPTTNLVPRCLPPKASAKQHKKTKRTISTLSISPVSRNLITMVCLAANIFFLVDDDAGCSPKLLFLFASRSLTQASSLSQLFTKLLKIAKFFSLSGGSSACDVMCL